MRRFIIGGLLTASAVSGFAAVHAQNGGSPYGSFGFDQAGMDQSVKPGDDFFNFANGSWVRNTQMPADKARYGTWDILADRSREQVRGILDAAARDPDSNIGTAYTTFGDTAMIERKGLGSIKPWMDHIKALGVKAGYAALAAEANRNGVDVPFGSEVSQDSKHPTAYALKLTQAGLGMPDRDYYLSAEPKLVNIKGEYQKHIARMFTLTGEPNADARAKAIVHFETAIAQAHWTQVETRDTQKAYNKMTVAQLGRTAPGFDFATYFSTVDAATDTLIVEQPSAVAGEAAAIAAAPLAVLKDQLILRSLDAYASVLPKAIDDERFAFYGTVVSGTPRQADRWKRAVDFVSSTLTDDVTKQYVAIFFPPSTKTAADQLVKNVIAAMDARLDHLEWMSLETKAKAHAKLAAFTPKIGYPSKWHDYSALRIVNGDALGNTIRAAQWAHDWNISKLGKPIMRWEWRMEWGVTPLTVNAYADPVNVEIVFPAAILQPPFYDPKADPAINYGGIGAVIGHEMSHHFDDQGSRFNVKGELAKWWTDQDIERFEALTGQLVAQYDKYEPLPGMHVKGALTLGENIADLAGLTFAYDAYHRSLGGKPAPMIDGFTGEQRFYLGWAQMCREKEREASLRKHLLTDFHSPSRQRAAVVRNLDSWYAAYKAQPGQKLYLTREQRVRIW
jgi:putative endopeptidase